MQSKTFQHALYGLVYPLSAGAILVLLFNDHWLRLYHPSWLTGKLGDFCWLVFAPFICAVVLSWIFPTQLPQHTRRVGQLSIVLIGLWFTLAKTVPAAHELTTVAWEAIIGWKGTQRLDPTDLLTLPALGLSWFIWQFVWPTPFRHYRWIVITLSIVATLASDEPFIQQEIR
jgi:hypothetical protein